MNILVIGGAGYIGSHTVHFLQKSNHNPIIYDNLSKGHAEVAQILKVPLYEGDLCDKAKLKMVFEKEKIDAVMHFAACIEVGESVENPSKYYHNNVAKVLDLLDAMIEAKIKYFVFSSTAATFGEPQKEKVDENHPQNPINPYGRSKLMVEQILKDYDAAYGLKSAVLRYFNAAGCDDNGILGNSYRPKSHLIPRVLMAVTRQIPEFVIFGDDYPTPDGTCIRDFVHVYDLADAHLLALEHMMKTNESADYNLGNGNGCSVKEIVETVEKITGESPSVRVAGRRAGDPSVLISDPTKAMRVLGWKPKYSLLEIVDSTWMWEKNPKY